MSAKRDMDQVVKLAKKRGCKVSRTKNNHWRIELPTGELVFAGSTPSDNRSVKNAKADLRRRGIAV